MRNLLIIAALLATVTGCSIWPTDSYPARKYTLGYTQFIPDVNHIRVSVLIDKPTVDSSLDTLRIVIKNSERSIDYVADAEWANRLTSLIHESLVHSFENTGAFSAVSRPSDSAKVDKVIKISVRGFYMDCFSEPPKQIARVDYLVQVVDKKSRKVLASQAFQAQTYAGAERIESYVQALNQAHLDATTQIINWTILILRNTAIDNTTDEKES